MPKQGTYPFLFKLWVLLPVLRVLSVGIPLKMYYQSGTGTLIDDARGMYVTETIYSDTNVEQIKSIPYEAFHRNVDSLVMEADQEGYIRGYIILPGLIYGIAKNELVDAGISNPYSMQVPILIRTALARGRSGVVGMGKAVWPNVHVDDSA